MARPGTVPPGALRPHRALVMSPKRDEPEALPRAASWWRASEPTSRSGLYIPEQNVAFTADRSAHAVRGECEAVQRPDAPVEGSLLAAGRDVPQAHRAITGCRGKAAVRRVGQCLQHFSTPQNLLLLCRH